MYDTATSAFSYLHGDHLGSAGLVTNAAGGLAQSQEYDAWGKVRSGGISLTDINYTGQRLDLSGLLNYNARMYDPTLGRFISADSIVPGAGRLTLSPHDAIATEAWSQGGGGPSNPQDLNRYSYALNNPLKYTDPSGHIIDTVLDIGFIAYGIYDIAANGYSHDKGLALAADVAGALIPGVTGGGAAVRAASKVDAGNFAKATEAISHAIEEVHTLTKSQQSKISTMVAGVNTKTGDVAIGMKREKQSCGLCAEDDAVQKLQDALPQGQVLDPKDVVFSQAYRPRTKENVPVCIRCQEKYSDDQFVPGTKFKGR